MENQPEVTPQQYGGFWRRAAAAIIDMTILVISVSLIEFVLYNSWQGAFGYDYGSEPGLQLILFLAPILIAWFYYVGFEISDDNATPGKRTLGLRVLNANGTQPGIVRASARYLLHFLSILILGIGFLMAIWTRKKQTLHDKLAGTVVVRRV